MSAATTMISALKPEMTWADIEADRAKRLPVEVVAFRPDPRLMTNLKPHLEAMNAPKRWTKASATKARKTAMMACGCRICALALNPPLTFADSARFGLSEIGAESRCVTHGDVRWSES